MGYDPQKHHRHALRLKGFDYRQPGMYFVTFCTWERRPIFETPELQEILTQEWQNLPNRYPTVTVEMFVIMPNHVHGILSLHPPNKGVSAPSLSAIIGAYKSITTVAWIRMNKRSSRQFSGHLWQERFFDHIIRNDPDLKRIREYIVNNPLNALIRQGKEFDDKTYETIISRLISECSSES